MAAPQPWARRFRKDDLVSIEGVIGAHLIDAWAPTGWVVNGVILDDGRNILDTTFEFEPESTTPT